MSSFVYCCLNNTFYILQHFEEFAKGAERVASELERLRQRLSGGQSKEGVVLSTAEETLYDSADLYNQTREMAGKVLREGKLFHYHKYFFLQIQFYLKLVVKVDQIKYFS